MGLTRRAMALAARGDEGLLGSLVTTAAYGDGLVTCRFAHPFFAEFTRQRTGSFRQDHDQQTALFLTRFDSSGLETAVPLSALARDLGLDEGAAPALAADAAMIGMVRRAVLYVERICLDDPLPSEAVSGEASWRPSGAQRWAAREAVRGRVAQWVSGGGGRGGTREALARAARDAPGRATLARSAAVLDRAVAKNRLMIGGAVGHAEIEGSVASIAAGLAYIVALRERLATLLTVIDMAVVSASTLFPTDEDVAELGAGLARVCRQFALRLGGELDAAEAGLDDIAQALRRPGPVLAGLAGRRNAVHAELLRVEAMVAPWRGDEPGHGRDQRERLFGTYRLLARRDLPGTRWLTMEERYTMAFGPGGGSERRLETVRPADVPEGLAWLWN